MAVLSTTESGLLNALSFRPNEDSIDLGDLAFDGKKSGKWERFFIDETQFSRELDFESIEALSFFDNDPLSDGENMSVLFAVEDVFGGKDLFVQSFDEDFQPVSLQQVDVSDAVIEGYQKPDYQAAFFRTPGSERIDPIKSRQEDKMLHTDASEGSKEAIDPDDVKMGYSDLDRR